VQNERIFPERSEKLAVLRRAKGLMSFTWHVYVPHSQENHNRSRTRAHSMLIPAHLTLIAQLEDSNSVSIFQGNDIPVVLLPPEERRGE